MNRQVVPSILLSILFVTFFSIVLHQPDQPPAAAARTRSKPPTTRREARASSAVADRSGSLNDSKPRHDPPAEVPTSLRADSGLADRELRPTVQYRKIRTVPRDIGATSRDPMVFPPAIERTTPVEGAAGRWRKVR